MFYGENSYGPSSQSPSHFSQSEAAVTLNDPRPEKDASQLPVSPPLAPMSETAPPQKSKQRSGVRTSAIIILTVVLALIFGVGLFAGWQFANSGNSTSPMTTQSTAPVTGNAAVVTQQEVAIAKVEPAVVELNVTTSQGQQIGSGVLINNNGDIVTNNHVVSGAQTITAVLKDGTSEKAQLIGSSSANDLAVVRIKPISHMAVAAIGNSSKLSVGQEVLAIGNPLGITETATHGIVSALNRSVTESTGATIANAIQTDASINPGNSGGALINLQGQLIGIPTLTAVDTETNSIANGVGFAIPSNQVKTVVSQILQISK